MPITVKMADSDIRDLYNSMKGNTSKEQLANQFNNLTTRMLKEALNNLNNGSMKINDATDLEKIFRIYKDINGIQDGLDGEGSSKLPELNSGQAHIIEQRVKVTNNKTTDQNGNTIDNKEINLDDLAKVSKDDIAALLKEHEKQQNNDNASKIV